MQISKYKRLAATLLIAIVMIVIPNLALAVPNLQIYIPGATYDAETETWIIYSYDYQLWVVGANLDIYDVKFAAAVPTDEDGTIDVTWAQGQLCDTDGTVVKEPDYSETLDETMDYSVDPYISFCADGTPTMGDGSELPPHGVFPTSYYEYYIGDFGTTQEVQNYIPGDEWGDPADGEIKKFDISVDGYMWVDIVAYDHYIQANEKTHCIFSPFSHDGASTIPEPATMLLLGTGLIGLAAFGRKKFRGGKTVKYSPTDNSGIANSGIEELEVS
ncbi:MAG: choice-of-anchor N protein [Deltaproteobacteria bacterium]|nr:choice-of-anchor N protein [Deltaproteobacteria bacterium]